MVRFGANPEFTSVRLAWSNWNAWYNVEWCGLGVLDARVGCVGRKTVFDA